MKFKLVDAHTHVQLEQFNEDRDEVIKRALDAGVWIINAGSDKKDSQFGVELANKHKEGVYAAVGQHPTELSPELVEGKFDYEFFRNLAQDKKVVAIGECGLEYYRIEQLADSKAQIEKQKELFIEHIKLAKEVNKPLVIHCREAFPDLIEILESNVKSQMSDVTPPGVLHFFTGTLDDAKKLLDLGFYFTFGGVVTFPQKNNDLYDVIKYIPLDRIMVETDAPYVAPVPYRGKRNEPVYIIEVAKKLAEIKGVPFEKVCEQTTENVRKVFGL